jgi:hypothetical protein
VVILAIIVLVVALACPLRQLRLEIIIESFFALIKIFLRFMGGSMVKA